MKSLLNKFWSWYERNYLVNLSLATVLFTLQIIHLFWLSTQVAWQRLFGQGLIEISGVWQLIIILVDYTEIPALLATSLVYINEYRKHKNFKSLIFLILINSQYLHIFWITDEFVVEQFREVHKFTILPLWLAWIAIIIDYLELPVIFDTIRKLIKRVWKNASFAK